MTNEMVLMICSAKKRLTQKLKGTVTRRIKTIQSPSRAHSWKIILIPLPQKSGGQVSRVVVNFQWRQFTGGEGGGEPNVDRSKNTCGPRDEFDTLLKILVLVITESIRGRDLHTFLREFDVSKLLDCEGGAGLGSKDGSTGERARSCCTGSLFPYELEETSLDIEDGRNNVVDSVGPDDDDSLIALGDGGRL